MISYMFFEPLLEYPISKVLSKICMAHFLCNQGSIEYRNPFSFVKDIIKTQTLYSHRISRNRINLSSLKSSWKIVVEVYNCSKWSKVWHILWAIPYIEKDFKHFQRTNAMQWLTIKHYKQSGHKKQHLYRLCSSEIILHNNIVFPEDQKDSPTELAFKYAVYKINRGHQVLRNHTITYDIQYVPRDDSFRTTKKVYYNVLVLLVLPIFNHACIVPAYALVYKNILYKKRYNWWS